MVNHFAVIVIIVELFMVTPIYNKKYSSGVTEMLKKNTTGRQG
jgi:hypothetical protein